ncbi:MAG: prolyl oligopeptidase family serine peptidase [Bacteroidota bacterium]
MTRAAGVPLAFLLLTLAAAPAARRATPRPAAPRTDDPYLWLEDVEGKRALAWVAKRDEEARRAVAGTEEFQSLERRIRTILDSRERIPDVTKIGSRWYNFWQDRDHPRGLWRRTTLTEYRKKNPAWEPVLDLDRLSRDEKIEWVWHDPIRLPPHPERCLVQIARGGSDAQVVREFDLDAKSFVKGGFSLPEAKSAVAWKDRDLLYVATDFGPGSLTTSGYPRIVKEWKRGTPLSAAATVFEGKPTDVDVYGLHDFTPGFPRDIVSEDLSFFTNDVRVRRGDRWVALEKPPGAIADFFDEWLLLRLRQDWTIGRKTWTAGSLLAIRLDDFLAGKRSFDALFTPTSRAFLQSIAPTRATILMNILDNVQSKVRVARREGNRWRITDLPGVPRFSDTSVSAVDPLTSDDYFMTSTGFLTPTTLLLGRAGEGAPAALKRMPSFFDTTGLDVSQHFAVSKDGTRVPYFQVARRGLRLDGSAPTMVWGYGGFELAQLPYYSATAGVSWLTRGGVVVLANIRGGGEFGPRWHEAALLENRPRAYEDFIAVGEDLVRRRVTSPRHLGCWGGSNGGLLVGNVLTMRPDLWGAVVCEQPLLDMRRYSKLLAGASWMAEYGDPDDPRQWAFIRTFSPYQNVRKGVKYPPVLFTTSTRDDRVHPGHARKMAAKMLAYGNDVTFYENVEGGHAGASTHEQEAFMLALAYEFLWDHLK